MRESTITCPETIKKRNGTPVPFDIKKISSAIHKANDAAMVEAISPLEFEKLVTEIVESIPHGQIPNVEQIQDLVEEKLIEHGYAKTAKAYILYRAEHTKVRKTEADLVNIYRELTFTSAADADIKRENANIDADTSMGTMLKYGSEGANYFVDNYILPKDIAAAHINGDIHIHDKDFYMLTETCCQIDLVKMDSLLVTDLSVSQNPLQPMLPWHVLRSRQTRMRCMVDRQYRTLIMPWQKVWHVRSVKNIMMQFSGISGWNMTVKMYWVNRSATH